MGRAIWSSGRSGEQKPLFSLVKPIICEAHVLKTCVFIGFFWFLWSHIAKTIGFHWVIWFFWFSAESETSQALEAEDGEGEISFSAENQKNQKTQ